MKTSLQSPKRPLRLPDSVHYQLNQYALAASAAGVGLLALAQPAEAKIVYTKAHTVIHGLNDCVSLDLNHDGIVDFRLEVRRMRYPFTGQELAAYPPGASPTSNTVRRTYKRGWAAAYRAGVRIGPNGPHARPLKSIYNGALMEFACPASTCPGTHKSTGNWLDVRNRYLGLAFVIKGKIHYGWARLNASIGRSYGIRGLLTGYAYETVPNKAIITGKTEGPDVVTVPPGSLGRLAQGSFRCSGR